MRRTALFYLVPSQWSCAFCACIKTSSPGLSLFQQPCSPPVPVLHLLRTGSSHFSCSPHYSFPPSLGWSYELLFLSLSLVEMFSKSFIAPIILLALTSSVNAHAAVSPALAVNGAPVRNDVQRPSSAEPCGNVNIAQNLDSSTPVQALANGTFSPSIADFNA